MNYSEETLDASIGKRIRCIIYNEDLESELIIDDAKLQKEGSFYFICQNLADGAECLNKLGYIYSWAFQINLMAVHGGLTNFEIQADEGR